MIDVIWIAWRATTLSKWNSCCEKTLKKALNHTEQSNENAEKTCDSFDTIAIDFNLNNQGDQGSGKVKGIKY